MTAELNDPPDPVRVFPTAKAEAVRALHLARDEDDASERELERHRLAVQALIARANQNAMSSSYDETAEVETWDDPREKQRQVRGKAWRDGLVAANLGELAGWSINSCEPQHAKVLRRFVETIVEAKRAAPDSAAARPPRLNLIHVGNVGNGKTAAAIAAGNAAVEGGLLTRFVSHENYLTWLRPDQAPDGLTAEQVRSRHRNADLLILDDLGAEMKVDREVTEFVSRETNELIGARVTAGRPTIVTTNVKSADLTTMFGPRIMSRLTSWAWVEKFTGEDFRQPQQW